MALETGTKLDAYEILGLLGAGGMGEVYRARDTKLGREVAIKVLPEDVSGDEERLARFKREAKILASLNHPNIAAIYGLEQFGGTHYLVLELVEGETLQERLARGRLPVDEAITIARRIAEGLEEAHELGVVHRDLKPGNVKITPGDKVKVLDFGLAKALVEETPETDSSMSPTLTRDATRVGVILGTAAYMSPEQAKGKHVDRRTDIFAFGALLYEMLTGRKAFAGEDVSEILAAVIKSEPDWSVLPPLPSGVRQALELCLRKNQNERLRHMGDVSLLLAARESDAVEHAPIFRSTPVLVAALGGLVAGAAMMTLLADDGAEATLGTRKLRHFTLPFPEGVTMRDLSNLNASPLAFSPDGDELAYTASDGQANALYLASLDTGETTRLEGTEGASQPFFSPDGDWIGFVVTNTRRIMKVSPKGGRPITVGEVQDRARGGSWTPNGEIIVGSLGGAPFRLPETGGTPRRGAAQEANGSATRLFYPESAPPGNGVLLSVTATGNTTTRIDYLSAEAERRQTVVDDAEHAKLAPSGHLLFTRGDELMAVPFDSDTIEVRGPAVRVTEDVRRGKDFAISNDGTFAYVRGDLSRERRGQAVWVGRTDVTIPIREPLPYTWSTGPRLSPDGKYLAVATNIDDSPDIWLLDLDTGTFPRLTVSPGASAATSTVWSRDGERIYFSSDRIGEIFIPFVTRVDGGGAGSALGDDHGMPTSASSDDRLLVYTDRDDIGVLSLEPPFEAKHILSGPYQEHSGMLSHDDRYLAYVSDESGREEVYVRPFPELDRKAAISVDGGNEPQWSADGRELFYRNGDAMMAVPFSPERGAPEGAPRKLFEGSFRRAEPLRPAYYDVHPDGRFVMVESVGSEELPREIHIILNWTLELERLAPTDRR